MTCRLERVSESRRPPGMRPLGMYVSLAVVGASHERSVLSSAVQFCTVLSAGRNLLMKGIEGRVAIVSGGATSIGAEIVRSFVAAGANAMAADVAGPAGVQLTQELGSGAGFVRMDLASDADIEQAVAETIARYERIDFVVNAAACYVDNAMASGRDEWRHSLDVNLIGPVMLIRAAHEQLARHRGAVVNVGSISARVAQRGRWLYPSAKAGLHQATRSLALDFAESGVRVNTVSPGWTFSASMEKFGLTRPVVDRIAADYHLIPRAAHRREIADVVVFLCSDDASFINAADVPVDGGYSAIGPEAKAAALQRLVSAAHEVPS